VLIIVCTECLWAQDLQGCVLLKSDVNEYSKEYDTRIVMQKNRILPFRNFNPDKNTVEVMYKDIWIQLPTKYTKIGGKGLCSIEPKCVISNGVTNLKLNPDINAPKLGIAYEDQKLPFLGRQKIMGKIWIQVDLGDKIAWVESGKVRIENKACGLNKIGKSAWSIEFEAVAFNSKKINEYQNVFFYSNDQDLATAKDPIYQVRSISHQGASINTVYEKNKHSVSAGVGFAERDWTLKKFSKFRYTNPIPPNNCEIDTPLESSDSYKEKFIIIPISYRYQLYEKRNHRFRLRPQLYTLLSLEPKFKYKYRIPCNTEINGVEKSNPVQAHGFINLDYIYSLKKFDLGVSFGLETSKGMALSLMIGF